MTIIATTKIQFASELLFFVLLLMIDVQGGISPSMLTAITNQGNNF